MKLPVSPFLIVTLCLIGVMAAQAPSASLLVLSKQDHTLAIVDPVTLKIVAKMPVGNDPHEVIASADGKTAYVSNYGFGAYNTLAVLDLVGHTALASIDLGPLRGPHGLTFVAGKTWFTAEAAKSIGRYDPATGKVDWILGTGQNRTHMIYVSDDKKHIVTTNVSSGSVSLIDEETARQGGPPPPGAGGQGGPPPQGADRQGGPGGPPPGGPGGGRRTDWSETVVKVGNGSEGFDLSPDRKEIWVGNAQDGTISVIDYAARRVVATLAAKVDGVNRLKFTPDGKLVIVSTLSGPDLIVLDTATRAVVKRFPIGHGAAGIQVQPDGARAFVACTPDDYVAVIDLKTLTMTGKVMAGGQPDGMAWVGP